MHHRAAPYYAQTLAPRMRKVSKNLLARPKNINSQSASSLGRADDSGVGASFLGAGTAKSMVGCRNLGVGYRGIGGGLPRDPGWVSTRSQVGVTAAREGSAYSGMPKAYPEVGSDYSQAMMRALGPKVAVRHVLAIVGPPRLLNGWVADCAQHVHGSRPYARVHRPSGNGPPGQLPIGVGENGPSGFGESHHSGVRWIGLWLRGARLGWGGEL